MFYIKKLFLYFVLFLSFQKTFLSALADSQKFNPEDIKQLQTQFAQIQDEFDRFGIELNDFNDDLKEINKEFVNQDLKNNDFSQLLKNFKNKKFYELPLGKVWVFPIKIGVYGDDILRLSFLGADILNDKKFYDKFVNSYNQLVLEKILDKPQDLVIFLNNSSKHKDIYNYFKKNQKISFTSFLKADSFANLYYFIFSELIRLTKDSVFDERTTSFEACVVNDSSVSNDAFLRAFYGFPIKISSFAELYFSCPLEKNKFDLYFLNLILQGFILFYSSQQFEKPDAVKILEKYYSFLTSYLFIFFKEIFVFRKVLTSLDSDFYAKKRASYFVSRKNEIIDILNRYVDLKNQYPKRTKANDLLFLKLEEQLKDHIELAHETDFRTWLRNKNAIYNSQKIIMNWLVHIPTYYLIVKQVFSYFQNNYFRGQEI